MRVVDGEDDLPSAFATAQAEAEANFRDGRLYLERLVRKPRHIEVQVLGDRFGTIVHLGERDCSIQKPSHQKLIEEAPAPALSEPIREKLHATALAAARAVGYSNAGTLEFLVDGSEIYFMEMNTRIQVEHPITELIYGVDLVKEQIRIAAGEHLGFAQDDMSPHGYAIECRINAEDPANGFAPSAGTLVDVEFPGGPGVRVDTHIVAGSQIPPYYDSLLAKVVAVGRTRANAIARMERALSETRIEGVPTTIEICRDVLRSEAFRAGGVDVEFLPSRFIADRAVV